MLPRSRSSRRTALRSDRSTSNRPGEIGSSGSLSRRYAMAATRWLSSSRVPWMEDSSAPSVLTAPCLASGYPLRTVAGAPVPCAG